MKKTKLLILAATIFSLTAFGQNKFGHINKQEVFMLMPEAKTIQAELEEFEKTLQNQLSSMVAEYEQQMQDYQNNESTYSELVKQDKEAEIIGLQERIQTFNQRATTELKEKEISLIEPIEARVNTAIQEVAEEGGYTYIFEKGVLHFATESNDLLPLVKKKLGI